MAGQEFKNWVGYVGKDLDLHHVFVSTYCVPISVSVQIVITETEDASYNNTHHSLPLLIFFHTQRPCTRLKCADMHTSSDFP